jgi:lysophospholipid acyltransferase (LPLAT)-like uncharacterized protein
MAFLAYTIIWWLKSLRFREYGGEYADSCRDGYILAVPHQSLLMIAAHHSGRDMLTMASMSADGEIATRILDRLGYIVVRGSSSSGASSALRKMLRRSENHRIIGLTVDGPRGPAWHVQSGVAVLAKWTGLPILPLVATCPGVRTRSWDRLLIPLPFARCNIYFGKPVIVGRSDHVANVCETVEDTLTTLRRTAGLG